MRVGERKERGVVFRSRDGAPFQIANATFRFLNPQSQQVAGGAASVAGGNVFALIQPAQAGIHQLEIECDVIPADGAQQSERHRPTLTIVVT